MLRVMVAAGGTGGGVYPALAAAEAMCAHFPETTLHFVGAVGGMERPLLEKSGLPYASHDEVQSGPIHGVNPLRMARSLVKLSVGTRQSFRLLRRYRPHAILSTGGWVSFPVSLAARLRRVPIVIYLPDIEPGLTIKVLRHLARKVAITVPDSERYFRRGQTVVTGYPLRAGVVAAVDRRDEAVAHFRLDPARQTLLVWGGSLGSRAINIGVISILPQLLADGVQIIHVTGATDRDRAAQQVAELGLIEGLDRYRAFEYLHEDMALALAAADLTICRAGASTLGEFTLFGLPSILIPLAYSWRYQQINAEYLASRGAAVHLPEERMATDLLPAVRAILNDPARRSAMRETARSLARPDGALNVARVVAQVAGVMA